MLPPPELPPLPTPRPRARRQPAPRPRLRPRRRLPHQVRADRAPYDAPCSAGGGVRGCRPSTAPLFLQRPGDAAVLPDAPEVDGHEDDDDEWQQQHVEDVPPQQRLVADLLGTE